MKIRFETAWTIRGRTKRRRIEIVDAPGMPEVLDLNVHRSLFEALEWRRPSNIPSADPQHDRLDEDDEPVR